MTDYPNYKSPAERKKDRIRADIVMIDKALESGGERIMLQVHQHIDGKYQACIAGWNAIAAPATTATIPEINVNTTEKVPDLMQFQVWYFFFALEDARNGYSSGFFM
jgi:hypothetical protein